MTFTIEYTQTYRGASGSGLGDYAVAYAIHLSVVALINDPVFQKYVTCNDNLVARTKEASKKLKKKSQAATAAASATLIKRGPVTPETETMDEGNHIKIALFPMNIFSSEYAIGKGAQTQNKIIQAVSVYTSDDSKVNFVLCYKHLDGYNDKAKLLSDISSIEYSKFWSRKSVFSPLEPDWGKVRKVGLNTNANVAVFIRVNFAHSSPTVVNVYLYEFETKKIIIKTAKTGKKAVAETVIEILEEYLGEGENRLGMR